MFFGRGRRGGSPYLLHPERSILTPRKRLLKENTFRLSPKATFPPPTKSSNVHPINNHIPGRNQSLPAWVKPPAQRQDSKPGPPTLLKLGLFSPAFTFPSPRERTPTINGGKCPCAWEECVVSNCGVLCMSIRSGLLIVLFQSSMFLLHVQLSITEKGTLKSFMVIVDLGYVKCNQV